jgi:hypothetical protein
VTLLLIMVSGESLLERGRLEKKRKPKSGEGSRWSSGHPISWVGFINVQLRAKPEIAAFRLSDNTGVGDISNPNHTDLGTH